jgi:asparagine synthase (glutamine-hydrolysing)
MKGDKMTMAASLEGRIPLLDSKLIEYAASIPSHIKVKPFKAKHLLKQAYADFLPEEILTRKKMGFNVPTGTWFRGSQRQLLTQLLLSEQARDRGLFNEAFVAHMLREHLEGHTNYEAQLFILASLELWFRIFIDPDRLDMPRSEEEPEVAEFVASFSGAESRDAMNRAP